MTNSDRRHGVLPALAAGLGLLILGACASAPDQETEVQAVPANYHPGAPGEEGRTLSAEELGLSADLPHTDDDVRFMQNMIHHHAQALEMTALVPERTRRADVVQLSQRIEATQVDEILLMQRWLERRGEEVPVVELRYADLRITPRGAEARGDHHAGHTEHAGHDHDLHEGMAGMLTPEQFQQLEDARNEEFDRLFLEFMISHHQGAVLMSQELFRSPAG